MELNELREKIDDIDSQIVKLFVQRMEISKAIGKAKSQNGISVEDKKRQKAVLDKAERLAPEKLRFYVNELYLKLFSLSKLYQRSENTAFGLVGERVEKSFSPKLHGNLGNYSYKLLSMNAEDFDLFMKFKPFKGINVTMPYKEKALAFCSVLSEEARAIGCVNTVVKKNNELYGYNTDLEGLKYMLFRRSISLKNKNVLILGTGGTSKTAEYAAHALGALSVKKVSRSGKINYENVYELQETQVIINTTPVGMAPDFGSVPIDLSRFGAVEAYADVVYTPLNTAALVKAKQLGLKTSFGLDMLCAQAFFASEIFTGQKLKTELLNNLCGKMHSELSNIVLMGMPGSGKSRIAKMLGKRTGRTVFDTDKIIERKTGKKCKDIITELGEKHFRLIESETVREVSAENGCIIALGGGSVLMEENRRALSQNGVMVYIKRANEKLSTKGRPLSQNGRALGKMLAEREPVYNSFADFSVNNNGYIENTVNELLKKFEMQNKKEEKYESSCC